MFWKVHSTWESAEKAWDEGTKAAQNAHPLKVLKTLPKMPGMTEETARGIRWKALKWMIFNDYQWKIFKGFLRRPFFYGWRYLKSVLSKSRYLREGDFFFYGVQNIAEFKTLLSDPNSVLLVGFSYCHKPLECPSGRFTDQCIHDPENNVCRQCFIGKAVNALPEQGVIPLFIPTVHYIGEKVIDAIEKYPRKKILFLITACEMTLEMFSDYGNMAAVQGIGVRLDGRICNTMEAFALSEKGIKPGLTVVLDETQKEMLELIRCRYGDYRRR